MRYEALEWCGACKASTPHNRRSVCLTCRSRARKANRAAKASNIGAPLLRHTDLLKAADALWSIWLRAYHVACEVCETPLHPDSLQCMHGWTRTERAVRFEPSNTFAGCAPCHRAHTPPRIGWYDWMRERLGEAEYARVEQMARAGGKLRTSDLQLVVLDARARIVKLPEGDRKAWAQAKEAKVMERMVRLGGMAA